MLMAALRAVQWSVGASPAGGADVALHLGESQADGGTAVGPNSSERAAPRATELRELRVCSPVEGCGVTS